MQEIIQHSFCSAEVVENMENRAAGERAAHENQVHVRARE